MDSNNSQAPAFWLQDPRVLLSLKIVPDKSMARVEKLNALTRALILVALVLFLLDVCNALAILMLGLLLIICVYTFSGNDPEHFTGKWPAPPTSMRISEQDALANGVRSFNPQFDAQPHGPPNDACWFNQDTGLLNAAYEITPPIQFNHFDDSKRSYMNNSMDRMPQEVDADFAARWRQDSDMNGYYSMTPDELTEFPVESVSSQGEQNYIVRSKIDHLPVSQGPAGMTSARAIAEQAFVTNSIDFRNSLSGDYSDYLIRQRKHNCPDMPLWQVAAGSGGTI